MVQLKVDEEIKYCDDRFSSFFGNAESWLKDTRDVSQSKTSARQVFTQILSHYQKLLEVKKDETQLGHVERIYCRLSGIQAVLGETLEEKNEEKNEEINVAIKPPTTGLWKGSGEYEKQIKELLKEVNDIKVAKVPMDCRWADVHAIYRRICLHLPQLKSLENDFESQIKNDKNNYLLLGQRNVALDNFEKIVADVQNIYRNFYEKACLLILESPKHITALPVWTLDDYNKNMAGTAEKKETQYGQNGGVLFHEEQNAETQGRKVDLDLIFNKITTTERHLSQLVEKNFKTDDAFTHVAERAYYMTEYFKRNYGEELKFAAKEFPKRTFKLPVWGKDDFVEYISKLDDANTKTTERFFYIKMLSLHIDDLQTLCKNESDEIQKGEYTRIYQEVQNFFVSSKEKINEDEKLSVWKGYLPKKIPQYPKVFGATDEVADDAVERESIDSDVEAVEPVYTEVPVGGPEDGELVEKKGFFTKIANGVATAGVSVGGFASNRFDNVIAGTANVVSFTKGRFAKIPAETTDATDDESAEVAERDIDPVQAVSNKDDDDLTGDDASDTTGDDFSVTSSEISVDELVDEVEPTLEEKQLTKLGFSSSELVSVTLEDTDFKNIDPLSHLLSNAVGDTSTLLEQNFSMAEDPMPVQKRLNEDFIGKLTRVISNGGNAEGKSASRPFPLELIGKKLPFELPFDGVVFQVIEKRSEGDDQPLDKFFLISGAKGELSVKLVAEDEEGSHSYHFTISKLDRESYEKEGVSYIRKIIQKFSPEGIEILLQPNYFKLNQVEDRNNG